MGNRQWRMMLVAGAVIIRAASAAEASPDRSGDVSYLLGVASPEAVSRVRGSCASGNEPASIAMARGAGFADLPDMVDECVAALTRLGRDGVLGFVRDPRTSGTTPALSLDTGFVTGFHKRDTAPDALPTMATLRPRAELCLAQREKDTDLCYSIGYAYGIRAADGEVIATP